MRDRADRRLAAFVGIVLAIMTFANDIVLSPPDFLERGVEAIVDVVDGDGDQGSLGDAEPTDAVGASGGPVTPG